MDKEFILLSAVENRPEMTQRELADKTGLSLGTVNILLKKMLREGLIKLEKIPANRTLYILTPQGLSEKANKTLYYIKHYYRFIDDIKMRISDRLQKYAGIESVHVDIADPTLRDIVFQAIKGTNQSVVDRIEPSVLIITDNLEYDAEKNEVININEVISHD